MTTLPVAVVGGGHLGTIHARLLGQVEGVELVAIVEPEAARAAELGEQFSCPIVETVGQLWSTSPPAAAVVAAPTSLHHEIGLALIDQGVHLLVEKPLAPIAAQCRDLVLAAQAARVVLQVGHVERFNPAWSASAAGLVDPRFITAVRQGPLTFRSLDCGVVLDLMIHDIDLILSLVSADVTDVQARGFAWTGPAEDIALAQITFANGCVAQLSASRVSRQPARVMHVYGDSWQAEVDFAQRASATIHAPSRDDWQARTYTARQRSLLQEQLFSDILPCHAFDVSEECNPILEELRDFVTAVRHGTAPRVSGDAGWAAVDVANRVVARIEQRRTPVPSYPIPTRKAG